jgi:Flp pilus assembly protein TadG
MHYQLIRGRRKGSALLEFTLVGIPLIFLWLSVVQMGIGMWQYHTIQYAVKMATSYASVHGATCASPNSCFVNVSDVVNMFQTNAIGVPMSKVALTLTSQSGASVTCSAVSTCSGNASWSTTWPPTASNDNAVGKWIKIRADYTFNSSLAMFLPGSGSVHFGSNVGAGAFDFPGYSYQLIQF